MPSYQDVLLGIAQRDERVVVMTAENRSAIRGVPAALGDRFVDVGICEQTMIGMAAGLALRGRRPIVHALAAFLTMRAFEFIRTDVGIARLPVKLVGAVPGFLSEANGPTHQAIEDIALMGGIPQMQIVCPADEVELLAALPHVMASDAPCYLRFNASRAALTHQPYELGVAEVLCEGEDVSLLTYGPLVAEAVRAVEILEAQGVSVHLVNMRTLRPLDERAILDAAAATGTVVTIEDHLLTGGLYSMVAELLARSRVHARLVPFALESRWFTPGRLSDVLELEGFSGAKIAARTLQLVHQRRLTALSSIVSPQASSGETVQGEAR